jgi:hypothetical protein
MRQDTMSAKWRKERSTVETKEIMKTAAHRSELWCWRQLHAADTCSKTRHVSFLGVKTQTSVLKEQEEISSLLHDVISSTRKDVIRHTYYLGVRAWVWITNEARLRLLSHVLMLVLTQLVFCRPKVRIWKQSMVQTRVYLSKLVFNYALQKK